MTALALSLTPALCAGLTGCKSSSSVPASDAGSPDDGPVVMTRAALLGALGQCAFSTAEEFRVTALALESATATLAATPEPAPAATVASARVAFAAAADAWQVVEAMQFGPAARPPMPGGQGLRDHIYSWDLVSACAVDELVVSRGYATPAAAIGRLGLDELEQLLHQEGTTTSCPASSSIVAGGTWAALSNEERDLRRRQFAAAAATNVLARADALVAAWDPTQGNFVETLATAGAGSSLFKTAQKALNAVSDAIFYVESQVKDKKVAIPLGMRPESCADPICPDWLESKFASRSKANIGQNLIGLRRMTEGCGAGFAGLGFDDLLEAIGQPAVAEDLRQKVAAAQATVAAIEEPDLGEALVADYASVKAIYDALRAITQLLKVDIKSLLQLELPMGVEGDVD